MRRQSFAFCLALLLCLSACGEQSNGAAQVCFSLVSDRQMVATLRAGQREAMALCQLPPEMNPALIVAMAADEDQSWFLAWFQGKLQLYACDAAGAEPVWTVADAAFQASQRYVLRAWRGCLLLDGWFVTDHRQYERRLLIYDPAKHKEKTLIADAVTDAIGENRWYRELPWIYAAQDAVYVSDYLNGNTLRIDPETGERTTVAACSLAAPYVNGSQLYGFVRSDMEKSAWLARYDLSTGEMQSLGAAVPLEVLRERAVCYTPEAMYCTAEPPYDSIYRVALDSGEVTELAMQFPGGEETRYCDFSDLAVLGDDLFFAFGMGWLSGFEELERGYATVPLTGGQVRLIDVAQEKTE